MVTSDPYIFWTVGSYVFIFGVGRLQTLENYSIQQNFEILRVTVTIWILTRSNGQKNHENEISFLGQFDVWTISDPLITELVLKYDNSL